jgi:hypothetical protein
MTADFQRQYGLRLEDAVVSRTETELEDLVTWLAPGSAMHVLAGAKGSLPAALKVYGWSVDADLLLSLANLISHQTYVVAQVQSAKKLKPPEPIKGPRGKTQKSAQTSAGAMARKLLAEQKG